MKYKITRGEGVGQVVELPSPPTGNYVKVVVSDGKELTVATKDLQPIFEVGDVVAIKGLGVMRYKIVSIEKGNVFITPTQPKWGEGRLMFPKSFLEPIDPILHAGDLAKIIGNPDVIFKVLGVDSGLVEVYDENLTLQFKLPSKYLEKV